MKLLVFDIVQPLCHFGVCVTGWIIVLQCHSVWNQNHGHVHLVCVVRFVAFGLGFGLSGCVSSSGVSACGSVGWLPEACSVDSVGNAGVLGVPSVVLLLVGLLWLQACGSVLVFNRYFVLDFIYHTLNQRSKEPYWSRGFTRDLSFV